MSHKGQHTNHPGGTPPVEHQFQPGVSGNPKGRPSAGAALVELVNVLGARNPIESELRRIARDQNIGWMDRAAAERALRTLEAGDIADFEDWLTGDTSLQELREKGLNTELLKKCKIDDEGGRSLELHDRAGADFDRIADRTEGRPSQALKLTGKVELPTVVEIEIVGRAATGGT